MQAVIVTFYLTKLAKMLLKELNIVFIVTNVNKSSLFDKVCDSLMVVLVIVVYTARNITLFNNQIIFND